MTIIVAKDGEKSKKIEKSNFELEDKIQDLIHNNAENLPFYGQDESLRLLSLGREFPTHHGPIDVIGIDDLGEIYIIEAKLHKNSTRREVVAQVMDYASAIWAEYKNFEEFQRKLKDKTGFDLKEFVKKNNPFSDIDDNDIEQIVQKVKQNIQTGNFKFVIVMDKLDDKLTNIIDFLNIKSSFSIYAVTFDYYKPEGFEIIIPNVYGRESEKASTIKSTSIRNNWNKDDFDEEFSKTNHDTKTKESIESIITFTKNKMPKEWTWYEYFGGTGKEPKFFGCFPEVSDGDRSVFEIYSKKGDMRIYVKSIAAFNAPLLEKFLQLCDVNNFEIIKKKFDSGASEVHFKRDEWVPKAKDFLSILEKCF
jgi:hypothetical protein